ncbi:MAG: hypothetical protein JWO61_174 [Candidatus Saccharibacteria bacterium]|nr:hypothetical protein [Candidatus Saccharibacteria bacterium]
MESKVPDEMSPSEKEYVLMYPRGDKERPIHRASEDECNRVMRARLVDTALSGSPTEVARYFVQPLSNVKKKRR